MSVLSGRSTASPGSGMWSQASVAYHQRQSASAAPSSSRQSAYQKQPMSPRVPEETALELNELQGTVSPTVSATTDSSRQPILTLNN